jgi:hypothetical protein
MLTVSAAELKRHAKEIFQLVFIHKWASPLNQHFNAFRIWLPARRETHEFVVLFIAASRCSPYCLYWGVSQPMRLKARGLAYHGGPPGWLEERDPAGVILYVMDGLYSTACLFRTLPVAPIGAAQLLLYINVHILHNHPSWAMSRKEGMACTLVDTLAFSLGRISP